MTTAERRLRERADQRRLIIGTARSLAEREGWDAVTTRRLSTEIEYSQPVIYKHFASLVDLAEAVALEGFSELTEALRRARSTSEGGKESEAGAVARAYCTFAAENSALYDAMFTRATRLPFHADDAPNPLTTAYAELRAAVSTFAGDRDVDTLTEVFWAALHGLITLQRADRLRSTHSLKQLDLLVRQFSEA
ncbi:TetR family transcriptional regulator [Vibrio cholerae]|nr:TetR family transcriptional regulator [Vibrio cholerae]